MIGRDWNRRRDKKRRVLSMSFTRLSIISSSIVHRRAEQLRVDREIETSFVDLSSTGISLRAEIHYREDGQNFIL